MRLLTICTTNSINFLRTIQRNVQHCPASRADIERLIEECALLCVRSRLSENADWYHFLFVTRPFRDDFARVDVPQLHCAIITPASHFLPTWRQRYLYSLHLSSHPIPFPTL
ncbi:hypothetical protein P692DRAFT_20198010 [Suillus brevipes Sb2]|nr:hypothetical protein P692DRAFT_20198010 [Suillus brevipes Sb2]